MTSTPWVLSPSYAPLVRETLEVEMWLFEVEDGRAERETNYQCNISLACGVGGVALAYACTPHSPAPPAARLTLVPIDESDI